MRMKKLFLISALFAIASVATAQNGLTLRKAVETSLKNNLGLKASELHLESKEKSVKSAYGRFYPSLSVDFFYTHMNKELDLDLNPIRTALIGVGSQNTLELEKFKYLTKYGSEMPANVQAQVLKGAQAQYDQKLPQFIETVKEQTFPQAMVNMQVPLFTGGKLIAGVNAAEAQVEMEKAKEKGETEAVFGETVNAYLGVLLAKENLRVRQEVLDGIKKHAERADKMLAQGLIAKHDKLRADVALSDAERNVFEAEQKLRIATTALVSVMQSGTDAAPADSMAFKPITENAEYFKVQLKTGNPVLLGMEYAKKALHEKSNAKYGDYFPTVFAYGFYNVFEHYMSALEPQWGIGIGAHYNIFEGLRTHHEYQEAEAEEKAIELQMQEVERKLKLLIENQYMEMKLAENRFSQLSTAQVQAEENMTLNAKRYETGMGTSLEVIDASLALESIKLQRIKAINEYFLNMASLYRSVGRSQDFVQFWNN